MHNVLDYDILAEEDRQIHRDSESLNLENFNASANNSMYKNE